MIAAITITPLRVPDADSPVYVYNVEIDFTNKPGVWAETLHESQVPSFLRGLQAGSEEHFIPMIEPSRERAVRVTYNERSLPVYHDHVVPGQPWPRR